MLDKIPDFQMTGDDGRIYTPADFSGKKLVLFFYPKDNTTACTIENIDYSALQAEFARHNCMIAGISKDGSKTHCNFKSKQNLHHLLLTDPEWSLASSLGLIQDKTMYGKPVRGLLRSTYLFDEKGMLIKSWINIKAPGHAQEVLNFIKAL